MKIIFQLEFQVEDICGYFPDLLRRLRERGILIFLSFVFMELFLTAGLFFPFFFDNYFFLLFVFYLFLFSFCNEFNSF